LLAFLIRDIKELPIRQGIVKNLEKFITILPIAAFLCFVFFSPFTYNLPMNKEQFKARAWLKLWNLRCVNCPREGIFIPKD
jgi:dolichyl-phosphate-mannose--protein O-mannosyl transferase